MSLGTPLQVRELARLHDPVRGLPEEQICYSLQEPRSSGGVAADHEPRTPVGYFSQLEAPQRVDVEARPRPRGVDESNAVRPADLRED